MKLGSKRKVLIAGSCLSILFIILLNNNYPKISDSDKKYITAFLKEWKIEATPEQVHQSFETEIAFISRVQDSIVAQVKHFQIPHQAFGNVSYYFANRKGQCYDRAVLMEKIFSYYQFPFRHLYIYFGKEGKNVSTLDFFEKGLSSHALFELKTSKGWMTCGTNANWIGLDKDGQVLSISDVRKRVITATLDLVKDGTIGFEPFWKKGKDFRFVYGVYSRHGDFFNHSDKAASMSVFPSSFHLLPDYNLRMLFYNFFR
jgi:hypothetical protein